MFVGDAKQEEHRCLQKSLWGGGGREGGIRWAHGLVVIHAGILYIYISAVKPYDPC